MRLVNIWVGLGVFSIVIVLLFGFASNLTNTYGADNSQEYKDLAGNYDYIQQNDTSTIRQVANKLEDAEFSKTSSAVGAVDNVLEGIKLFGNSIKTVDRVGAQVAEDAGGRIDPILVTALSSIFTIIIVIIALATIWRFRPEA